MLLVTLALGSTLYIYLCTLIVEFEISLETRIFGVTWIGFIIPLTVLLPTYNALEATIWEPMVFYLMFAIPITSICFLSLSFVSSRFSLLASLAFEIGIAVPFGALLPIYVTDTASATFSVLLLILMIALPCSVVIVFAVLLLRKRTREALGCCVKQTAGSKGGDGVEIEKMGSGARHMQGGLLLDKVFGEEEEGGEKPAEEEEENQEEEALPIHLQRAHGRRARRKCNCAANFLTCASRLKASVRRLNRFCIVRIRIISAVGTHFLFLLSMIGILVVRFRGILRSDFGEGILTGVSHSSHWHPHWSSKL